MEELKEIKSAVRPQEILLVVDAMTGQDAVTVAESFDTQLGIDGIIMTKLDGDARGGAALSVRSVTNKPIKILSEWAKKWRIWNRFTRTEWQAAYWEWATF